MNSVKRKHHNLLRSNKLRLFLGGISLFLGQLLYAQEAVSDSIPPWKQERKIGILINQSSFDNWLSGGVNSFSGTLNFDYDLAYENEKLVWISTLDAALGYARTTGNDHLNKTEDQLEFNTLVQLKSKRSLNFSSSFNLKTQNVPGNIFVEENGTLEKIKTSGFFSPAYMRFGVGFAYKKDEGIAIQFNPLNARLIVVDGFFTQDLSEEESFFGVAAGKTARWETGASFSLQSELNIAKNIFWKNQLNAVANYLEEIQNIDFDYLTSLNMKVNDYLSAVIEIQMRYDDNALADLQLLQTFGLVVALPF